jgi:prephenate dehydrogenase
MRDLNIGFIGLGLIGGSIAKGIKRIYNNHKIIAYNRSENSRLEAVADGTVDISTDTIDSVFSNCDYIFLCTPVEHNVTYLDILKDIIKDDCIITDVGSVKGNIHRAVESKGLNKHFIGGHPMAGSEKTGYSNSSSYLLENAYYVLTPTSDIPDERVNELYELVKSIGAIPIVLDYKEHDYAVAAISHIPHLIASSLVNLVKDNDFKSETMKLLAAGGFKDITRIASSSPDMWQQICFANNENICELLDKYIISLSEIKDAISEKKPDYIYKLFEKSRDYRNSFSNVSHGPIEKSYCVYCNIIDESGAISTISTKLANNNISIKNIGIVHNRESEEGVLKIEFYSQEAADCAEALLNNLSDNITSDVM